MNDTFRNTTRYMSKVEMKQEPVTVSDTRKVELSIIGFHIRYFVGQCLKDLHNKERKKMNNTMCPKKTQHLKISSSQNGQYLLTRRQNNFRSFFISDVLFTNINHFQSSKILQVTFFGGHLMHCPQSHIQKFFI